MNSTNPTGLKDKKFNSFKEALDFVINKMDENLNSKVLIKYKKGVFYVIRDRKK